VKWHPVNTDATSFACCFNCRSGEINFHQAKHSLISMVLRPNY